MSLKTPNLSRNKTYTHSFITFPPLFAALHCSQTIEMLTNIFLCKLFVIKITPFTIHIEGLKGSRIPASPSKEACLYLSRPCCSPAFLPLGSDRDGADGAGGMSLLLCMQAQQKGKGGCLMLRVNWIDPGTPFQHHYLWQVVQIIDQWTYNNNLISFHLNNYLLVISDPGSGSGTDSGGQRVAINRHSSLLELH